MTDRRPPPPPAAETTALLERPPGLSDSGDTDPRRVALRPEVRPEAPTGRFDLDDLEDHLRPSALPSAYVSEFDVSDLDGDIVEGGAATTIMQLPPEMLGHHDPGGEDGDFELGEPTNSEQAIEMMRWRAGPPAAAPADTLPEPDPLSPIMALQPTPLPPVPGRTAAAATRIDVADAHSAATLPALSLDMVREAAARARAPRGLRDDGDAPTNTEIRLSIPDRVRTTIDEALAAVLAAQSCADDGAHGDDAIHDHLARAVQLLSAAQELAEDLE